VWGIAPVGGPPRAHLEQLVFEWGWLLTGLTWNEALCSPCVGGWNVGALLGPERTTGPRILGVWGLVFSLACIAPVPGLWGGGGGVRVGCQVQSGREHLFS
jgi:hypothetical protein